MKILIDSFLKLDYICHLLTHKIQTNNDFTCVSIHPPNYSFGAKSPCELWC